MKMRAAVYYKNTDIRVEEMPRPQIGDHEILMQVEASGICGSDVMEWYRIHKVPLVLGHEVSGVAAEVGKKVRRFKKGGHIIATHHVPCGECEYCRSGHETVCEVLRTTRFDPGGFCEYLRLSQIHVKCGTFLIPKNVSFEEATFVEPLGCVIRGQRLAGMKKGKRVLVVGSGLAGLLHVKLAKYLKAKTICAVDLDEFRLRMAKDFGADETIDAREDIPSRVLKVNNGRLADIVIICAAAPSAFEAGLKSLERGGTLLIFTAAGKDAHLPVSTNDIFWRNEATVLSSYGASPADLKEALNLISKRKISVRDMITHRLKLSETQKGFDLVVNPKNSLKVIIKPQE